MEIAIAIAGLLIAWFTFTKTFYAKPKEEKQNLLAVFLATQTLSKEVSDIMTDYAVKMNALEVDLYKGITYRAYIEALKESQRTNLSDELFENLKKEKLTKSNIATMQSSLEAQFDDLQKMKSAFSMAKK